MGLRETIVQKWRIATSVVFLVALFLGWYFFLHQDAPVSNEITWNDILIFVSFCSLLLLVVALLLWELLKRYLEPTDFDSRKDFLDLFIKIVGGTTLLVSLFTTWKSIRDAQYQLDQNKQQIEKSNELARQTMEATQASLEATRTQQIEERFYKAIEKLDSDDAGIRTGAIYSLGKIADQSDDHYWLVMQVLSGYVRERHRWNPKSNNLREPLPCPPDLQAVFNVVGMRRNRWLGRDSSEGEPQRLDFSGSDLRGLILRDNGRGAFHFEGLRFVGANLQKAEFVSVFLDQAVFDDARLEGTVFLRSSFAGAAFQKAQVDGNTDFMGTEKTLALSAIAEAKDYQRARLPLEMRGTNPGEENEEKLNNEP